MDEEIKTLYKTKLNLDIDRCILIPEQLLERDKCLNLELKIGKEFRNLLKFVAEQGKSIAIEDKTVLNGAGVQFIHSDHAIVRYENKPVGWGTFEVLFDGKIMDINDADKEIQAKILMEAQKRGMSLENLKFGIARMSDRVAEMGFIPEFLKANPLYIKTGIAGRKREVEKVDFSRYYH